MKEFIKRILELNEKIIKAPNDDEGEYYMILSKEEYQDLKDIMEFVIICTEKAHKKEFKEVKKEIKT